MVVGEGGGGGEAAGSQDGRGRSVVDPSAQQAESKEERRRRKAAERLQRLTVVVVGGGLGGLATALALQRRGVAVKVLERDAGPGTRRQGYGLTLTYNQQVRRASGERATPTPA